ncbi:MAG TPA: purine-nucleoside phosphorylase [Candidatus Krumholzibacteria bacterium]|nr:purine-nucleoside phosphorylase [Candidatus Krumholzibacteria bacterium]
MSLWRLRDDYAQRVEAGAKLLREEGYRGRAGVVLGSGLGNFADQLELVHQREFSAIPGFYAPSVAAHKGKLLACRIPGTPHELLVLQGRLHAYEGHAMEDVLFPIATLLALGVQVLVLTNAAGGAHPDARAGDLVALTGLLDAHGDALRGLVLPPVVDSNSSGKGSKGGTPAAAGNSAAPASLGHDAEIQLRAATHNGPFDRELALRMVDVGAATGIPVATGTYVSLWGPSYETPKEIGFYRSIGASAIGMSTGPEAAFAQRLGVKVVGVSCITNVAREHGVEEVSHEEVIAVGAARREDFARLLLAFASDLFAGGFGANP